MPTVITATCGAGAGGGANDMQLSGKDSAGMHGPNEKSLQNDFSQF